MSSPFTRRIQPNSPTFALSATALVLGLMIGLAWITNQERQRNVRELPTAVQYGSIDLQRSYLELQGEVKTLRAQLTNFEKAASTESGDAKLLEESLKNYKIAAGVTELVGPGLLITLTDSRRKDIFASEAIIHDTDLLRLVNELWASGAEALSINGQRVIAGTPIRCVGPTVQINYVPTAPPIRISALGDPVLLEGGVLIPAGLVEELRDIDSGMVTIEKLDKLSIPAFSGALAKKLAVVPEVKQ